MEEEQIGCQLDGNVPQIRLLLTDLLHALGILLQMQHELFYSSYHPPFPTFLNMCIQHRCIAQHQIKLPTFTEALLRLLQEISILPHRGILLVVAEHQKQIHHKHQLEGKLVRRIVDREQKIHRRLLRHHTAAVAENTP